MKCKNGHPVQDIKTLLTWIGDVEGPYPDLIGKQYVVILGFEETAIPCGCRLGDGYGDPYFFATHREANDFRQPLIIQGGDT
jgi:hypothetical protein